MSLIARKESWTWSAAAVVVAALVTVGGCRAYQRAKQVRSVANMQGVCALIERDKEEHRPIDEERIRTLVGQVAGGRDGWGNEILVATRDTPAGRRYVLVSRGSDGRLDVDTPARYFDQTPTDVREDAGKDIVFIDGKEVTNAGK
jgi:hypothetical protein